LTSAPIHSIFSFVKGISAFFRNCSCKIKRLLFGNAIAMWSGGTPASAGLTGSPGKLVFSQPQIADHSC
jgi:hypothetical protein